MTAIVVLTCNNGDAAPECVNTRRPLTRSSDSTREGLAMKATRTCSADKCDREHYARGYCRYHYKCLLIGRPIRPRPDRTSGAATRTREGKVCTSCEVFHEWDKFSRDSRRADGRRSICRDCDNLQGAERRAANGITPRPAALTAEQRNERDRARYRENAESEKERKRVYRAAHPEVEWRARYVRRSAAAGFKGRVEYFTHADVVGLYGDGCFYCGGDFEHLDHFIPVSLGGDHVLENVRPACAPCNIRKQNNPAPAGGVSRAGGVA